MKSFSITQSHKKISTMSLVCLRYALSYARFICKSHQLANEILSLRDTYLFHHDFEAILSNFYTTKMLQNQSKNAQEFVVISRHANDDPIPGERETVRDSCQLCSISRSDQCVFDQFDIQPTDTPVIIFICNENMMGSYLVCMRRERLACSNGVSIRMVIEPRGSQN